MPSAFELVCAYCCFLSNRKRRRQHLHQRPLRCLEPEAHRCVLVARRRLRGVVVEKRLDHLEQIHVVGHSRLANCAGKVNSRSATIWTAQLAHMFEGRLPRPPAWTVFVCASCCVATSESFLNSIAKSTNCYVGALSVSRSNCSSRVERNESAYQRRLYLHLVEYPAGEVPPDKIVMCITRSCATTFRCPCP